MRSSWAVESTTGSGTLSISVFNPRNSSQGLIINSSQELKSGPRAFKNASCQPPHRRQPSAPLAVTSDSFRSIDSVFSRHYEIESIRSDFDLGAPLEVKQSTILLEPERIEPFRFLKIEGAHVHQRGRFGRCGQLCLLWGATGN